MSPILGGQSRFLLDASVCIAGPDRAGLERLLPTPGMEELEPRLEQRPSYCARPPVALERIEQVNEDRIVFVCRSHSATDAPLCPSPRWSLSTTSPPGSRRLDKERFKNNRYIRRSG